MGVKQRIKDFNGLSETETRKKLRETETRKKLREINKL